MAIGDRFLSAPRDCEGWATRGLEQHLHWYVEWRLVEKQGWAAPNACIHAVRDIADWTKLFPYLHRHQFHFPFSREQSLVRSGLPSDRGEQPSPRSHSVGANGSKTGTVGCVTRRDFRLRSCNQCSSSASGIASTAASLATPSFKGPRAHVMCNLLVSAYHPGLRQLSSRISLAEVLADGPTSQCGPLKNQTIAVR
jgi:hypothetical protein